MLARKVVVMGAERSAPDWGAPLNEADYEKLLKESWITRELADQAMLCRVSSEEGQQIVGRKGRIDCSGILIPYYWPGETQPHTYRLRRDKPDLRRDKNGELKPDKKYLAPPSDRNRLYIPPGVTLEQLSDPAIPVVIVEGEKKALALQSLAYYESKTPRFIPVAIPGVWNWRGVTGKAVSPGRIFQPAPLAGGPTTDGVQTEWSLLGVQTARVGVLASIWRPNRVLSSLLFSVSLLCK